VFEKYATSKILKVAFIIYYKIVYAEYSESCIPILKNVGLNIHSFCKILPNITSDTAVIISYSVQKHPTVIIAMLFTMYTRIVFFTFFTFISQSLFTTIGRSYIYVSIHKQYKLYS